MSGADIAAEVAAAIGEAGAATGNGAPLTGTIVRPGAPDTSTFPPTPGAPTEHACTLILTSFSVKDRMGTQIPSTDLKAMISPDAETDPRNGDALRVAGETYSIVDVMAFKPGGEVLYWSAQVRRG